MICTWESRYRLYLSEEISYTDCPKITTSHLINLKLWWAWKRCFIACEALLAIAEHCTTFLWSHDCILGSWQPVHTFNSLPSTRQSCNYHLQSSLLPFAKRTPFHLPGLAERAALCWNPLAGSSVDPSALWPRRSLNDCNWKCWDCDCWAKQSREFPWIPTSLNCWDSSPT